MASPDTIILFVVDYHAAVGGQDPSNPSFRTPVPPTRVQTLLRRSGSRRGDDTGGRRLLVGVSVGEVADRVSLEKRRRDGPWPRLLALHGQRQQVARVVDAEIRRTALPPQISIVSPRHHATASTSVTE